MINGFDWGKCLVKTCCVSDGADFEELTPMSNGCVKFAKLQCVKRYSGLRFGHA